MDSLNTPRLQAGLGRVKEVYREGDNISTLLLARVVNVNHKYNTVDVETIGTFSGDTLAGSTEADGRFSAKLPIQFGGTNYKGKAYGQTMPVENGNMVLIGFINGRKKAPIVLSIYADEETATKLNQAQMNSSSSDSDAVKANTNQAYTLHPSLTYENIDGLGNRTVSFTGKSFLVMSQEDKRVANLSDSMYGVLYESQRSSYYSDGEIIEPISEKAPIVLYKHQGIKTDSGAVDNHVFMAFVDRDGTMRLSETEKGANWKTYFEMKPDKSIGMYQMTDSSTAGMGREGSHIAITEEGIVSLRSGDNLWELKDSRILNNGKDAVAQALEEEMRAVNKVLDLVRKANDLDRWYNKFPKMIDDFVEANGKDDPRLGYSNRLEIQEYYSDIQENKDTYLMYAKQYSVSSTDFENAFKSLQAYVDSKSFFGNTPYIQIIPSETKEKFMTAFKKCSEMLYKIIDKGTQNMSGYQLGIYDVHAGIRQTEKDVELYAGDFRVLEDRVVSNEASLKIQADKIEQKVSKVEIPNLIKENVRIGGANYFYDKQVVSLGLSTESNKVIEGDQYLGWFLAVKPEDVLSIQRWSTPNNQFSYVFTKDVPQKGIEYFGGNFNTLDANKLKYEGIKVPEEAQFFFLYLSSNAYKETLPKIKVEFGNVATDYTEPDVATKEEMRLVKESVGDLVVKADEVTASVETVIKGLGENSEILSRTVANVSVLEGQVEAKVDSDGVINAINLDKTGAKIDVQHVDIVIGGENLLDDTEKEVGGSENPLMRDNWDIAPAIREYGYKRPYTISFVAKTRTNSRIMVSTTGDAFGIGSKVVETSNERQTFSYVFYPEPLANKDTGKSILTFVGDGPDVYPVVSYVSFKLGNVDVTWTPSANDRAKETLTVIQDETTKTVGNALEQLNRSPINLFRGFPYNQKLNVRTNNEQRYTYPFAEKGALIKVEPHTTYSFSWDYNYFSSNYGEDKLMVSVGSASETVPFKDYYFTNRLKDKELTFEVINVDPDYPYFGIRFSEVNNAVDTTNVDYFSLMLTKSNKPLDWAPNPNDLSDLAKQAEVDIDRALATLDDIAKDGKLTPGEKKIVAKEWATIQGEYPNIKNQAVKYAYNVAQLQTVYGNLDTYLTPLLADMTATTNVEPTEFHNKFKDYYTMKLNILNGVSNQLNGKLSDVSAAAEEAQRDADAANKELADISSDNKLTPAEKLVLKKDWDTIVNEFPNLYAQGALYTVSVSELKNAYDVLYAMVPPLLKDMNATTDIDGETFRHNFVVYYGRKVSFLNTIYGSLQTNINDQINKTNQAITRVNGEIDDMAKDGKLTPVEKKLLQKEYKLIIDEQSELKKQLAQYNVDYSKVQTTLTALSTYVDPFFTVMDQTSNVDGTKLKKVFNDYYNAKLTSLNAVANTINGYVTAAYNLADKAQKAAVDAKNSADKANNSISDMASDGKLTPVEKKNLATEWATIQGEFAGIKAQGTQYGVALGNYQNAYATLSSYVPDLLSDMSATSDIDPTTFRTNFKLYYNYKVDVTARVADVIQGNLNATNGLLAQAQTDATNAKNQAGIANSAIADMANDGKLTPVEKKRVAAEWEAIQSELPLLKAQAGRYAVSVTTYQAKYDALNTYITPLLQNMTATSTITASAFKSTFKGYYDAKVTLMNSISDVIKGDVTAVNNELATAKKQVDASEALLADMAKSGKLTPVEKKTVSKEWEAIKSELATLKTQATRYGVSSANYQTQYTNLNSYVTPLLSDLTTTSDVDAVTLKTNFKNYYDAKLVLLNEVSNAIQTNVGTVDNKVDRLGQYVAYAWSADGKDRFTRTFTPNLLVDNTSFNIEQKAYVLDNGVKVQTRYAQIPIPKELVGKTLTFSAYIKNLDNVSTKGCSIGFASYVNANVNVQVVDCLFVENNRVVFTGELPDGYFAILIYANTGTWNGSSNSIQVYDYKLEASSKVSTYSSSLTTDYDNAVPRYIGRCIKDSNTYSEYTWEVNPDRRPWVSYANDTSGTDFSLYPYGENLVLYSMQPNGYVFTAKAGAGTINAGSDSRGYIKLETTDSAWSGAYIAKNSLTKPPGLYSLVTVSYVMRIEKGELANVNISLENATLIKQSATSLSDGWVYYQKTFRNTALNGALVFYCKGPSTLYIYNLKAEYGNIATPWTPNSKDRGTLATLPKYIGTAVLPYTDYTMYKWASNPDYVKAQAEISTNDIADMAKDNKLTPVEKKRLKKEQTDITAEFAKLKAQGAKYGVPVTNIQSKYDALNNFINPLLSKMEETSDIDGGTLRSVFSQYYAEATNTSQLVADAIQKNVETADNTANTAKSNADTANRAISDMANDNLVTPIEKQTLADIWDRMKREYPSMIAQAGKYGLTNEQTAYSNAYNALNTYLNTTTKIFSSMSSNTSVDGAKLQDLVNTYYVTQLAITNRVSDIIQGNLDNIQVGSRNYLYGTYTGKSINSTNATGYVVFDPYSTHNSVPLTQTGLAPGDTVTVSFNYKLASYNNSPIVKGQVRAEFMGSTYLGQVRDVTSLSETGRFEMTATLNATTAQATKIRIRLDNTVAIFSVSDMKLEKGNKATDWMYSPEDIADGIANAKKSGDDANNLLDTILKDSTINPSEKRSLQTEWQTIQAELPTLKSQGSMYNINVTNLQSQYDALNTYLNTTIKVFSNMSVSTTNINVTDFKNKFSNYYKAKLDVLGAIDNFLKNNVDSMGQFIAYAWSADGKDRFRRTPRNPNLLLQSVPDGVHTLTDSDFWGFVNGWPATNSVLTIGTHPFYNKPMYILRNSSSGESFIMSKRVKVKPNTKYYLSLQGFNNSLIKDVDLYFLGSYTEGNSRGYNIVHNVGTRKLSASGLDTLGGVFTTGDKEVEGYVRIDNNGTTQVGSNAELYVVNMLLVEYDGDNAYRASLSEDYDNLVPQYIGHSIKDSNKAEDYTWEVNSDRRPWIAYANDEYGKDFSLLPFGQNILKNSAKRVTYTGNTYAIPYNFSLLKNYIGQYVSISVDIDASSSTYDVRLQVWIKEGGSFYTDNPSQGNGVVAAGKSGRLKLSGYIPTNATDGNIAMSFIGAGGDKPNSTFIYSNLKFEVSSMCTPWTPNVEEVEDDGNSYSSLDTIPKYIGVAPLPYTDFSKFKWDLNSEYVQAQSNKATNDVKDDMDGQFSTIQGDLSALGTSDEALADQLGKLEGRFTTFTTGTGQGTFSSTVNDLEGRLTGMQTTLDDKTYKLNFYDRHFIVGYEGILFDGGNSSTKMLLTESGLYFGKGYKVTEYQKDANGNIKDTGIKPPAAGELENMAVAYFSNENFFIKRGAILSDLQIGAYKFVAEDNNSLFINFVGEIK